MTFVNLVVFLRSLMRTRTELAAENLALRQQLAALHRRSKRPRLKKRDRIFWVWFSGLFRKWRSILIIVQPETVVRWHRQGFKLYWRWKSRGKKPGPPQVWREIRDLVRQMCRENPAWGAPRIHSELPLLGYDVSESTVANYMNRDRKPPPQTWRTFLENHLTDIVAHDFFTMPTATFRILFALVVLRHDRRRVMHFNVTAHPTAEWTAQSRRVGIEAFPEEEAPQFLIRDRDGIYGQILQTRVADMGIEEVVTAQRPPWQDPFVERLIGPIRRECLEHVIVIKERHLLRILRLCFTYYHESRTHLSLQRNPPAPRNVEPPERGRVIAIPQVGGLHHRYRRAA